MVFLVGIILDCFYHLSCPLELCIFGQLFGQMPQLMEQQCHCRALCPCCCSPSRAGDKDRAGAQRGAWRARGGM